MPPEFNEKAIIDRIIELRNDFAGQRGKSAFAKAIGLSPSTYNYYENDRLAPVSVLLKICQVTGANLHWLLTGSSQVDGGGDAISVSLSRKLDALLKTSPESESALVAFIDLLAEKNNAPMAAIPSKPESKPDRPGWIPILGRTAAGMVHFWHQTNLPAPEEAVVELDELVEKYTGRAILASENADLAVDLQLPPLIRELRNHSVSIIQVSTGQSHDDQIVQFVECPEVRRLFPDAFALQIDGDSMSPRINDGDVVVLSPSVPAAQGHIAVVRLPDQIGVTCKIIRTTQSEVHLIPINERYETKTVASENLLWALAVLCHIRI